MKDNQQHPDRVNRTPADSRHSDALERHAAARVSVQFICDRLPGEPLDAIRPTWGDLVALVRSHRYLEAEVRRLRHALERSVFYQAHYAKLLNMWDGGHRIVFENAQQWLDRLAEQERAVHTASPPATSEKPELAKGLQVEPEENKHAE
jgi:hypothetical protein